MENSNYQPFGEEWKKEINKLPKAAIIEMAAQLGQEKDKIEELKALQANLAQTKAKLEVAVRALEEIEVWEIDSELEWGEPSDRASAALEKIAVIEGF